MIKFIIFLLSTTQIAAGDSLKTQFDSKSPFARRKLYTPGGSKNVNWYFNNSNLRVDRN